MTAAELAHVKLTQPFRRCDKVGHLADTHNSDATLKPGTPSYDEKGTSNHRTSNYANVGQANASGGNNNNSYIQQPEPSIIGFTTNVPKQINQQGQSSDTLVCVSSTPTRSSFVRPIVDDGAQYSAISETELSFHRKRLVGRTVQYELKTEELQTLAICSG